MVNDTGTYHVQIDVGTATKKMVSVFDGCCMIAILPKCTITTFSPIEFLPGPTGNQLHGFWNGVTVSIISDKQMDVV